MSLFGNKTDAQKTSATTASNTQPASAAARETSISHGIALEGSLKGEGVVVIHGKLHGDIELRGDLRIGVQGVVEGAIQVRQITIDGHLKGDVKASERVSIGASGVVDGDITSPRVAVAEGATLRGQVNMTPKANSSQEISRSGNN